ncbi:MAG TPA: hypothetical protein VGK67_08435 [Myxococcales bacterium]|jgi:hypothetical protein
MLIALLALLHGQLWTQEPQHPPNVSEGQAVSVLASPDSLWEARFQALKALDQHRFTKEEVAALHSALASASTKPSGPCTHPPEPCVAEIGPCLSPAGFILTAVRESHARDAFVKAALGALDDPDDAFALPAARDILAGAGHPRGESEALSLLTAGTYCVGAGTRMLRTLPKLSDQARRGLVDLFKSPQPHGHLVLAALAGRPEPWAQSMASKALRHRDTSARLGTIEAVGEEKEISGSVQRELLEIARCDGAAHVRNAAAKVLRKRGVEVGSGSCPLPTWTVANGALTGPSGSVKLTWSSTVPSCPDSAVASTELRRSGKAPNRELKALGAVGKDCILAANWGEFGGALWLRRPDGTSEEIIRDGLIHPVAVLAEQESPDEVLVISSLGHMSGSGGVGKLRVLADGRYRYEPWFDFWGQPVAWAYQDRRLFISFEEGSMSACEDSRADTTLVFEPDGTFALARSEATRCLWP